jgi:riboflavin kinase/FMN adenylyltransferase
LKIFNSISDFNSPKKTILTLGTFDGVHFGHRKILEKVEQNTNKDEFESLVLTFFPHPRMILQERNEIKLLNTLAEKIKLLEQIGIQNLVIHPFDEKFSRLTAEQFVKEVLVDQFRIHKIIIGYDHRFGRNRTANIDDLIQFGKEFDFQVEQISVQEINANSISSTKVRKALEEGNIARANEYLGYPYPITGIVCKGKQLGRTIGFPTANLEIEEDYKLIPKNGVYIVKSIIDQKVIYGMMNIGTNPTVGGTKQTIEVHFLDFNADLYDSKITVALVERIREEKKFDSFPLLKTQLEADKATTRAYFKPL